MNTSRRGAPVVVCHRVQRLVVRIVHRVLGGADEGREAADERKKRLGIIQVLITNRVLTSSISQN